MAHFALLPFGSAGDVLPFIWLGRHLQKRGHRVTLITACLFEAQARAAGLPVVSLGTPEEFEAMTRDPRLWKLYEGTKLVFEKAGEAAGSTLSVIESLTPRVDLLLAPCTAFGARMAREKHGTPLLTVHLQPAVFISAYEPPVLIPGMQLLRRLPLWLRRRLVALPNPADRFAGPAVSAACASHGIAPPDRLWWDWGNSPDGVLALFPAWFAAPQPDWPANVLQWDFPLEDLAGEGPFDRQLQSFLDAGEKPIVFTAGSANVQAHRFFEVALAAVCRLKRRAVFVTSDLTQLPADLPPSVAAVKYAPFSLLLPQAAAFVHHGGIGTLSQGFAAGVPQLLMAMAHDQPDNAYRLQQLGAGFGLSRRRFTADRVTTALGRLLTDPAVAQVCKNLRIRMQERADPTSLMEWIEQRLPGVSAVPPPSANEAAA